MSVAKIALGARTQLSGAAAALNSLANGAYATLGTLTLVSSGKTPLDWNVELAVTPGTVAGNKQVLLFAQTSMDATTFTTGPATGTTATDEANLVFLGALPLNSNATLQRKSFSLAAAMPGGLLPYAVRLIAKNDSGAALASTGNDAYTQDATGDIT